MAEPPIDLRSDTATRPTPGMRAAMHAAEVGDDVVREDPTVNRLEERVAAVLGKEAALFVPSGTMSNQIAIRAHTRPGDELICDTGCHINNYEAGGPAVLSGVTTKTVDGDFGILDVTQLEGKCRPINEHMVRTRLVCLENTHNRGGGRVYPLEKIQAIGEWARQSGLVTHLDGARLWNAIVATGIPAHIWAAEFDTVSVCFSKGLGAPVGSLVIGSTERIAVCRRLRKALGGGMRQAGVLAAAGLIALEEGPALLVEDHRRTRALAEALARLPGVEVDPATVETNLLFITTTGDAAAAQAQLEERGILTFALGAHRLRFVFHRDVGDDALEAAHEACRAIFR